MKTSILTLILIGMFWSNSTFSQCFGDRFKSQVFETFIIDSNVVYGTNFTYDVQQGQTGTSTMDLEMDIYTPPLSDTMTNRPMLLFIHGGSFIENNRKSAEILYMCETFAKHGYVTATMSYRLGIEAPIDSVNALRMAYRAIQDGKAAVRFLRSKAEEYGIDPERIFAGGTSAGAILGLNIAYLNKTEELPSYVDTSEHSVTNPKGLDGLLGKTNELYEYSSKIQGIINLCGATLSKSWMDDADANIPVISMHGDIDGTVPYATDIIYFQGIPLLSVEGSYSIDKYAKEKGINSKFRTWCNTDHVPYYYLSSDSIAFEYMDSVMSFLNKHMYQEFLGCDEIEGLEENRPCIDGPPPADTTTNTYIANAVFVKIQLTPNPASNIISWGDESLKIISAEAINLMGKSFLLETESQGAKISHLPSGIYIFKLTTEKGTRLSKFIRE
ncbi:MAG: hypothetical protein ACJATA_001632 [Sphingobacteriales bacterium]|jgi:hypothetical protein